MDSLSAGPLLVCTFLLSAVLGLAFAAPATAQIIWRPPPGSNVYVTPSPVADTIPSTPQLPVSSQRRTTLPVYLEAVRALPLITPPLTPDPRPPSPTSPDEPTTVPYDWPIEYARSLFDGLFPSLKATFTGTEPLPPDSTFATRTP